MKLLTKEILAKIPSEAEDSLEARVYVKFFHPMMRWTWYACEYDKNNGIFYGYVKSGIDPSMDELGSFSLKELESVRNPLPIERDIHWDDKTTLRQVQNGEVN